MTAGRYARRSALQLCAVGVAVAVVGVSGCDAPPSAGVDASTAETTVTPLETSTATAPTPTPLASNYSPPEPPPATKRFAGTSAEHFQALIACVRAAGFVVVEEDDGSGPSFYVDAPVEQQPAADAATNTCRADLGDPGSGLPPTADQVSSLYDFYLDQRDCLIGMGHPVDEPPSRETFIATYNSNDGTTWFPYRQVAMLVAGQDPATWAEVNRRCPQTFDEADTW